MATFTNDELDELHKTAQYIMIAAQQVEVTLRRAQFDPTFVPDMQLVLRQLGYIAGVAGPALEFAHQVAAR